MPSTPSHRLAQAVEVAENILSDTFGGKVKLHGAESLGERPYVHRMTLADHLEGTPQTVIVKQAPIRGDETYDPDTTGGPASRLFNDWASLQFLTEVCEGVSPAARFVGGNRDAGVIVIEDLGADRQLDHFLLAENADAAKENLVQLSKTVGRMHAQTIGLKAEYDEIRHALGPTDELSEPISHRFKQTYKKIQSGLEAIGVTPHANFFDEIHLAATEFAEPGGFEALIHQDPCPDNCLLGEEGMRLLDFEHGRFGHALQDGVYPRIHFPTCWCVNRIPRRVWKRAEAAYREELIKGCPEAADDKAFYRAVAIACAWWAMFTFFEWSMPDILKEDRKWGISTVRQRPILRFDLLAQTTEELDYLPAISATSQQIATKLRELWQDVEEMPSYPAFR